MAVDFVDVLVFYTFSNVCICVPFTTEVFYGRPAVCLPKVLCAHVMYSGDDCCFSFHVSLDCHVMLLVVMHQRTGCTCGWVYSSSWSHNSRWSYKGIVYIMLSYFALYMYIHYNSCTVPAFLHIHVRVE